MASHEPGASHGDPIKLYLAVFGFLTVLTVIECFPLFGLWDIPASILLVFSAVKFVVVCAFFMHLYGDHPIYTKLFFIPLVMMGLSVMVLMTLFDSWNLTYRVTERGEDTEAIAARYRGTWEGRCNNWATSAFTGNEYCASPASPTMSASIMGAYEALKPSAAPDPRFDGFDAKTPEEKQAVLMTVGEEVYGKSCAACHQASGEGLAGTFPPLKGDPVANGAAADHVNIVLKGMNGVPINGVSYASAMPAWPQLSDNDIAAVVTYERLSWGNTGGVVEPTAVAAAR